MSDVPPVTFNADSDTPAKATDLEAAARGLEILRRLVPIPGRPGHRADPLTGFAYYSAEWLGDEQPPPLKGVTVPVTEAARTRLALAEDATVTPREYGRLVEAADQADQAREAEAEAPEPRVPVERFTAEAWDKLTRRRDVGVRALKLTDDGDRDHVTAATDVISDVLTLVFGPAGQTRLGPAHGSPEVNARARARARALLHTAFVSWVGDAEDYTYTRTSG